MPLPTLLLFLESESSEQQMCDYILVAIIHLIVIVVGF